MITQITMDSYLVPETLVDRLVFLDEAGLPPWVSGMDVKGRPFLAHLLALGQLGVVGVIVDSQAHLTLSVLEFPVTVLRMVDHQD